MYSQLIVGGLTRDKLWEESAIYTMNEVRHGSIGAICSTLVDIFTSSAELP